MQAINNLQESIHGHSITAINALQSIKTLLEQNFKKEGMEEHNKHIIKADGRRAHAIIEQILSFELMDDFYRLERNLKGMEREREV